MVGDSAAERRWLWNNFVTSRRSPEVANSCPKGLEKSRQLLKDARSTLWLQIKWQIKYDVTECKVMHTLRNISCVYPVGN